MKDGWYVEFNGDTWQSVFPRNEAHKSKLHASIEDALEYFYNCGVSRDEIVVLDHP